jgi:uncharacterized protein
MWTNFRRAALARRTRAVLMAYGIALLFSIAVPALVALGVGLARGRHGSAIAEQATAFSFSRPGILAVASANAVMLLSIAGAYARPVRGAIQGSLRLSRTDASALGLAASMAGMIGLSFACGATIELLGLEGRGVMDRVAEALAKPSPEQFLLALVAIAIAPAFAEETFFRGMMQSELASQWPRWFAIAVTAVAFGIMHLEPIQGSVAFVAGLYLGWVAERFGGIRPTVAAHATNNAVFVALSSLGRADVSSRRAEIAILCAGGLACAAAVGILRTRRATTS